MVDITGLASGVGVTYFLNVLNDKGIFAYVLPFLLIFAVVYGILAKAQIFGDNKGVNVIIALAVGLLALINDTVTDFFAEIFPRTGIAISILLVALILLGLFGKFDGTDPMFKNIFLVIGGLLTIFVVYSSLSGYGWYGGAWWDQYGPALIVLAVIVAAIAFIVYGGKGGSGAKIHLTPPQN